MDEFVKSPQIMREAGYDREKGTKAKMEMLNELVQKHSPVCCFLGDDTMERLYLEASTKQ